MSGTDPIDRAALKNLLAMFSNDLEFLYQVIDTYIADAANLVATIQQAVAKGNADELHRAAHSLKSNSANLGATALSHLARDLEELGRLGNAAAAHEKMPALETEFTQVKASLQRIRTEGL
jgi:HPt (histidine-containing phosphotransfer) domain-containing protein